MSTSGSIRKIRDGAGAAFRLTADEAWRVGLHRQLADLDAHRAFLLRQLDSTDAEVQRIIRLIREANP
jgi:hypothetical protein